MGVKEYQFAGDEIQKHLNKVFKPAVVEFEILHADFKMSELTSFSHGGSPWNSVYNDDQKRVLRAYNDSIKDGVYYLFFIDNVTDKKMETEQWYRVICHAVTTAASFTTEVHLTP